MKVTAIDMDLLQAKAFGGDRDEPVGVSRGWLQDVFNALSGETFASITAADPPAVRQTRILAAIDATISRATPA